MKSRIALVTGGSRGIGAAIIAQLVSAGHRVISPSRTQLDLASTESVEAYIASNRTERFDILVNNAGINLLNPIAAISVADWQLMLQTNLSSALRLTQAFGAEMCHRNWGRILNISSIFSLVTKSDRAAYSMTKAALNALSRSAAVEFGPAGVLVNSLAPGYVDTELTRRNNSKEAIASIEATLPLRRMATPDELARVACFLVSDDNTYITGQTLVADGGFTCH